MQFYVDGKPVGDKPLGLGIRVELDAFRLGAWNRRQSRPASNLHGRLGDAWIYSGTLTDAEAAELVRVSP